MNRGKAAVSTNIKVISSSIDKAKLFASNFITNSKLDNIPFPTSHDPLITISVIFSSQHTEVSKHIKSLDRKKATGPNKLPLLVLKNINQELFPILVKLFNRCSKEKFFPSL